MVKPSLVIRKNGDSIETLYCGCDCGKAIETYKASKGEVYLFEKMKSSRAKDTKLEVPIDTKRKAKV